MDSIDKLLAQVKAEYEMPGQSKAPASQPNWQDEPSYQAIANWQPTRHHLEGLLDTVKAELEEEEKAEELKRQQQLREEALRQEALKQQQRAAIARQAQEWLKKLNPLSDEGFWFEQFAEGYPSKLDAAIDYLQAMQQNRS